VPFLRQEGFEVEAADLVPIVPLIQERIKTLVEATGWIDFFFRDPTGLDASQLVAKKMTAAESCDALQQARDRLAALPDFEVETIDPALRSLADELGLKVGQLLGIVRVAVSGKTVAPPLFETLSILGRERVLTRIDRGIEALSDTAVA